MKSINTPHDALKIDGFQANLVHEIDIKRTKSYNQPTHGGNCRRSQGLGYVPQHSEKTKSPHKRGQKVLRCRINLVVLVDLKEKMDIGC